MTRKRILLSVVALFGVAIVGVAVVGTSVAQRDQSFAHGLVQNVGDDDVVATIQGKSLTRGEVRQAADFKQEVDPSLNNDMAVKSVIVSIVDGYVIQAEVERRELVPTEDEARAFMQPHKEACTGEHGQDCRNGIEQMGLTVEEYWANILPEYRKDLGNINLFVAVFAEQGIPDDATNAQLVTARDAYQSDLRGRASIVWHDGDLERLYEEAQASR